MDGELDIDFKPRSTFKELPLEAGPQCAPCGLHKQVRSPFMPVDGRGGLGIMVVGQSPGKTEDGCNKPFVGKAGQLLRRCVSSFGGDLERDCWITNSLICRSTTEGRFDSANRPPTDREIDYCRPNLWANIKKHNPTTIIVMGKEAITSLIGLLWHEDVGDVTRWVGWQIPCQRLNCWICPTYHPSYVDYESKNAAVEVLFTRHLKNAFAIRGRPWKQVPDFNKMTKCLSSDKQAAHELTGLARAGKPLAVDLETCALKPDGDRAEVICFSVSDGQCSIAVPWLPESRAVLQNIILNNPLIGANIKFEQRWFERVFGHGAKRWLWDMGLAAHVMDNRKGIASVKFQAFVKLGFERYDEEVSPLLRSKHGGNGVNRIRDAIDTWEGFKKILSYCGLDSLVEWKISELQMSQLGIQMR